MKREDTKPAQVSWNLHIKAEYKQQVFFCTTTVAVIQFLKAEKYLPC